MKRTLLALFAAAVLFGTSPASAQIGQTAILTGTVTDASGAALPGVLVTASSEALLGGSRTATTEQNGVYRFPALPPGAYRVTVEMSGFRRVTRDARAASDEMRKQLVEKLRGTCIVGVADAGEVHPHGNHVIRVEAGFYLKDLNEAADEKPGSDEKNKRQGDFSDHKHIPETIVSGSAG